jgi:hypothetical protein
MGAIFVPIVLVIVVGVVAVLLVKRMSARETEVQDTLSGREVPSLRYRVPEGQDPASVLVALRNAGYVATADDSGGGNAGVLVSATDGDEPDRETVRAVIAGSSLNQEGDPGGDSHPHFDDE